MGEMLRDQHVRRVVRSPHYPLAIAGLLVKLEAGVDLLRFAREQVSEFRGMRRSEDRRIHQVVILEVKD